MVVKQREQQEQVQGSTCGIGSCYSAGWVAAWVHGYINVHTICGIQTNKWAFRSEDHIWARTVSAQQHVVTFGSELPFL